VAAWIQPWPSSEEGGQAAVLLVFMSREYRLATVESMSAEVGSWEGHSVSMNGLVEKPK
jgi:hypothetical protein